MTRQDHDTQPQQLVQEVISELSQTDLEKAYGGTRQLLRVKSAPALLESAPFHDSRPGTPSSHYSDSNVSHGSLKAFMSGYDIVEPVSRTPSPPHQ